MEFTQEEYTKHYIVQALFQLMREYEFEKISVTDVVNKAGVGRATFYRYFKRKEDVILYYLERYKKEFIYNQRLYPRCKEDYVMLVNKILTLFKEQSEPFRLIRRARLEYIYLDYLNEHFCKLFQNEYPNESRYLPYCYAGMLYNVSMAWLDDGYREEPSVLAQTIVDMIFYEQSNK